MVTFILLEPSSQDKGVGQLYQALRGLTFSATHKGAYPNGGFKIFQLCWGTTGFALLGEWESLSPTVQKFTHPFPTRKIPS